MPGTDILVSKVLMPERGIFVVRVDEPLVSSGEVAAGAKGRFVVELDYGEDVGRVFEVEPYSPRLHGERVPAFRLVRRFTDDDAKVVAENEVLSVAMRNAFLAFVKDAAPGLRVPVARLSFGRRRLFLRYSFAADQPRQPPDLSKAQEALRRQFGVDVSLWAMGPRDEVAEIGGIGPCGRVCCCCSWQRRYPSRINPERKGSLPALMNGTCGRFKCCLAFERDCPCQP